MKRFCFSLIFVAGAVLTARADLVSACATEACPVHGRSADALLDRHTGEAPPAMPSGMLWSAGETALPLPAPDLGCTTDLLAPLESRTLPAVPDSAVLCLSAFASLGVWQLGRSVRKLHLSFTPEWYHDGGPTQVGHATPLDLEFSLSAMPQCVFDTPRSCGHEPRVPEWWLRRESKRRFKSQYALLVTEPRGPPSCA